jgi:uncharacterized membrane protein YhaH (DUF805 family)
MNWYLFSFEGRINRAKWWLSLPIVVGSMLFFMCAMWMLIMSFVVLPEVHADLHGQDHLKIDFDFGIDEIVTLLGRAFHHSLSRVDAISLAGNLVGMPIVMWIFLATSIKRLHDRDRSGWWIVPFFVLPTLSDHIQDWLGESIFTLPVELALPILGIWGLVEMGFLPGSPRTNLYGPSPLPKQQMRPRSVEARRRATTAWDQDSEIELIPHIGSPPPGMHVNRGT